MVIWPSSLSSEDELMFNFPRVSGMEAVLKYLASARYKKELREERELLHFSPEL